MTPLSLSPNDDKKNGTGGADSINGLAGNDVISGLAGNDTLIGGIGNDSLNGGTGNDVLLGDVGNDILLGDAGNDSLDGGADNDKLDGGAGADTLNGGTGFDTMTGGDGNDVYFVDNIGDRVIELDKSTSGKDTVKSSIDYPLPLNVENLELTGLDNRNGTGNAADNKITGNDGDNLLNGGDGFDTLSGGDGDDTLNGGNGADTLTGGNGSDTYQINSKEDRIIETLNGGDQDVVESSISYQLDAFLEMLTLTGTKNLDGTGNDLANTVEGNAADNTLNGEDGDDTLLGNAGDDTLKGGSGDDEIDGGEGDDLAVYTGNQGDYQITLDEDGQTWVIDGDEGTDRLTRIETLRFADGDIALAEFQANLSLSVDDISLNEGDSGTKTANFVFKLSAATSQIVSVDYQTLDETAVAESDYQAQGGTLIFQPGETRKSVAITVMGDTQIEPNETFLLQLSNPVGVALETGLATATLLNDERPRLSLTGTSVVEGNSGQTTARLTVTLSSPATTPVTVEYATADVTATADSDYSAASGQLIFAPGETSKTLSVSIMGDTLKEPDEKIRVLLKNPVGATLDTSATFAYITLTDDDTATLPTLSISDVSVAEGNSGSRNATVTVSLSAASSQAVTVNYTTQDGTATAGSDYTTQSGQISFAPGVTRLSLTVPIIGDTNVEPDETIQVVLTAPVNATLGDGEATLSVTNDDDNAVLPTLSIADTRLTEGNSGANNATVTVSLSAVSSQTITVNYATQDGTATAGSDYAASNGSLTFYPGQTSQTVNIPLYGDTQIESDENFRVNLSNPGNATLSDNKSAVVTVINDDAAAVVLPQLSLTGATVTEGQSGASFATLTVSLSTASSQPVSVNYTTQDGSATAGSDYVSTSNTLSFAPNQTTATIQVPILGDTQVEANESFKVNLSDSVNATLGSNSSAVVTVNNDDAAAVVLPQLSLTDATVTEGQSGASFATLTVTLSTASSQPVSVNYSTQDGSATAGSDYVSSSNTLSFAPNQTTATIQVPILGDTQVEANESFKVNLSSPVNATLGSNSSAVVTVINDDAAAVVLPTLSISGVKVKEGNSGSSTANATVTLSAAFSETVTVNYATQDGTALANSDYIATSGTLSFRPGETSKTLPVSILGDTTVEGDESFQMLLSAAANALLNPNAASGTVQISNDDTATAPVTSSYYAGQPVIDLGSQYGKLIKPVQVDGGHWFYYWDRSGDGTSANKKGAGYANSSDYTTYDVLDQIFNQDINGTVGGGGNTDDTYRYATINGVHLALPTAGGGRTGISGGYYPNGTAVGGSPASAGSTAINPTYDDLLAVWDAYNGTGTGKQDYGTPPGWGGNNRYWSATHSGSGHANVGLYGGSVYDGYDDYYYDYLGYYVALEVL